MSESHALGGGEPEQARRDNGLHVSAYVPLTDVEDRVGQQLLAVLGRARIAAYLVPAEGGGTVRRLFVASEERADARTIVAAAVRAIGESELAMPQRTDPLAGMDTDSAFAALIAGWHVDTVIAIRDAERDLSREDSEWRARLRKPAVSEEPVWLDDDHYVPPPPPPLPRFAGTTILAMTILAISIFLLGLGGQFGAASDLTLVLGVGGVLLGAGILLTRLRASPDDDDDGSAV